MNIVYYCFQIKEDGLWITDPVSYPIAVRQVIAHTLIEQMDLKDNARLIRVEKFEAISNERGHLLWLSIDQSGCWHDKLLPVDIHEE